MKYICLLTGMLLLTIFVSSQDYIITWKGDSLQCYMPDRPWKEGFRPARKYDNGHLRIPVVFQNDSTRVIEAGDVKAYSRTKHGRGLLCNGVFESKQLLDEKGKKSTGWHWGGEEDSWYFLQKLEEGPYANLYITYLRCPSGGNDAFYCIVKHKDGPPDKAFVMVNRKRMVQFLSDPDVETDMKKFRYKKNRHAYGKIVREYNRLKTETAIKSK
jgi:hypothetical protein